MSQPRIPQIGEYSRHCGTLVEVQDVTPKEIVLDYIFEDTEARLQARINGHVVKDYGTFNNFYGKDTCIELAIREAKKIQEKIGESNLEFVVIKRTFRTRKRPSQRQLENFYDSQFRQMDQLDHGCCWDLPDDREEVVWSSNDEVAVTSTTKEEQS